MEEHSVLITTSGIGSRLGRLTDYTNKSLVRVGDKPAISYIVESYSKDTDFTITLGHYGDHVRQFLQLAYPEHNFNFVKVENFSGKGSSLLHSMKKAARHLQRPFVFHACDAIVLDEIPTPEANWISGSNTKRADQYRTLNIGSGNRLEKINEKGEISFDLAYPGLVGIKDYKIFWKCLDKILKNNHDNQLSDCHVVQMMIDQFGCSFGIVKIDEWHDIGEPSSLSKSRASIPSSIEVLDKPQENIYILKDSVIKFFYNADLVTKRVKRAAGLSDLVPEIEGKSDNFFKYKFANGELFSKTVNPKKMKNLLLWSQKNMWSKGLRSNISTECEKFYFDKTMKRAKMFLGEKEDKVENINGEEVPTVEDLINSIDREYLSDGISASFHGDFILDNILENSDGFTLLDWRQDFAGRTDIGDIYYDLSKLNHNLIFNHEIVNSGKYTISYSDGKVVCDILCSKNLIDCQSVLHKFITDNNYDLNKVKILTAIIWINMSGLHEYPLNSFLFNFGKYNLHKAISSKT
jgi:NDP-sugar pyrophosphorylase family protein